MTDRLLTAREVAEWLGVSTETVLRKWRAGEIPGFRLAANLARLMGTSVEQIDETYGHLLPDSEEYLRGLLDTFDAADVGQSQNERDTIQ